MTIRTLSCNLLKAHAVIDLFASKLFAFAKPCVYLSHLLAPTSPMRIRRITLSTLTSRHRDQSLLAPACNPTLLSPSLPLSLSLSRFSRPPPFITSLAYHFVSPSRPEYASQPGTYRLPFARNIRAQRGATSQSSRARKPCACKCRF